MSGRLRGARAASLVLALLLVAGVLGGLGLARRPAPASAVPPEPRSVTVTHEMHEQVTRDGHPMSDWYALLGLGAAGWLVAGLLWCRRSGQGRAGS